MAEAVKGAGEAYEARREYLARLLAASLMQLVKDPAGDRLPDECWRQMLMKADAILFLCSPPKSIEHHLAREHLNAEIAEIAAEVVT